MSGRITVLVHKSHGPDHVKHVVVMYKVRLKGCPDRAGLFTDHDSGRSCTQ